MVPGSCVTSFLWFLWASGGWRCALTQLVQRGATGPAGPLVYNGMTVDQCVLLMGYQHYRPMGCSEICTVACRSLVLVARAADWSDGHQTFTSVCLVVDFAPHGHHEAAMFVVARLCVFAGPTSHASPSGSTGAGFAPTPLSSGGRPR